MTASAPWQLYPCWKYYFLVSILVPFLLNMTYGTWGVTMQWSNTYFWSRQFVCATTQEWWHLQAYLAIVNNDSLFFSMHCFSKTSWSPRKPIFLLCIAFHPLPGYSGRWFSVSTYIFTLLEGTCKKYGSSIGASILGIRLSSRLLLIKYQ